LKGDFRPLKRKLLSRTLIVTAVVTVLGYAAQTLLIDGVLQAPFARAFVWAYQKLFDTDSAAATMAYQHLIRNNKTLILLTGLFILAIVVFYASLSKLMWYFKEANEGVTKLVSEDFEEIRLSPEMAFMERKLNEVNKALRQRAADIQEAERRKDELVMYLAHDIRTPLTSVIGYLNFLQDSPGFSVEEYEKYVKIAIEKANRLEFLVNEFFEITRYNNSAITLEKENIDLSYMLTQLADEFFPLASGSGKTIALRSEGNLAAFADPDKLARVFNNLLKNAVAYSAEGSAVEIGAYERDGYISVEFKNQGNPITASELEIIFRKHCRLSKARSSATGGAGLGLAIAREIVNLHGGEISAKSDESGTVFAVRLPKLPLR
jgi:two-component system sensor histidine kinase VanS